jgi:hypothetical protein
MAQVLGGYQRLAAAIASDPDALRASWVAAYERSPMRMPGAIRAGEVTATVDHLFRSVGELLTERPRQAPLVLTPGSSELREIEQAAAFLGANLASSRAAGFDVAALLLALREVLCPLVEGDETEELARFIEWLAVVGLHSFGAARASAVVERYREQLEEGTPVIHIVPELPAALLVGAPEREVVDSVMARLLLSAVRVDASALILDVAGLADATAEAVLGPVGRLLEHRKLRGRIQVLVAGLAPGHQDTWRALDDRLRFFEHFDRAVAEGLRCAGYRLVRSPTAPP